MSTIITKIVNQRISATYTSYTAAHQAKCALYRKLEAQDNAITIVSPTETNTSANQLHKEEDINKPLFVAVNALLGFVVGLIIAFILVKFGSEISRQNPITVYSVCTLLGVIGGCVYGTILMRKSRGTREKSPISADATKKPPQWTLIIETKKVINSSDEICRELKQTQFKALIS